MLFNVCTFIFSMIQVESSKPPQTDIEEYVENYRNRDFSLELDADVIAAPENKGKRCVM